MRHAAAAHPVLDAEFSVARIRRLRAVLARLLTGSRLIASCYAAGTLGAALLAGANFPAAGNDDRHITYWAAHALAAFGRVVNYNGELVEQSSSLGLVLLLAGVETVLGGMVPYYVFREHFGAARFIDRFALTSPSLVTCLPERAQKSQQQGVRLSPDYLIRHSRELEERCGVGRPDIVFSNGRFPKYLRRHGYVKVYEGPPGLEAFVALDRRHRALVGGK